MKKWIIGIGLIALGVIISFAINFFVIEGEYWMLRPEHKNFLLAVIFWIPAVLYEVAYVFWYYRCAIQKDRTLKVYKYDMGWISIVALLDLSAILLIFWMNGMINESPVYVFVSFVISTIFFCIAVLRYKPF